MNRYVNHRSVNQVRARLEELRLQFWAELKYWHFLNSQVLTPTSLQAEMGLTDKGYELFLTDDSRALHEMDVQRCHLRTKSVEMRFTSGFGQFQAELLKVAKK